MFPPYFYLLFLCPANPVCQYLIRTGQLFQLFLHGALPDVDFHPFGEHRLLCCFTQCYKLFCCHRHIIVFRIRPEKRLRHVDVIVKSASNDGLTILRAVDKESAQEFVQETLQEVWETADDWFIR